MAECINNRKKNKVWLYLIVPALILSFALSFFFFSGEKSFGGEGLVEQELHHVAPLYTLTDTEWQEVINSKILDDATTECSDVITEGIHHTMYCDKIAGSDTELSFTTYFKSKVKNYKITEIKYSTEETTQNKYVGAREIACPEESKNITCYDDGIERETIYITSKTEAPLTAITKDNNWELSAKRDFVLNEKRTYKVEWDDIAPIKTEPQTKDLGNGILRTTFPLVETFYNELSINPNKSWNYSVNNWGGVASHTQLDVDDKIMAEEEGEEVTLAEVSWDYQAGTIDGGGATAVAWNHTIGAGESGTFSDGSVLQVWGGQNGANACTGVWANITMGASVTDASTNTSSLGAIGCSTEWSGNAGYTIICNITDWTHGELSTLDFNVGDNVWFILWEYVGSDSQGCQVGRDNSDGNPDSNYYYWDGGFTEYQGRDFFYQLWLEEGAGITYASVGNRTLDGYCPNAFDNYEVVGAGFSQEDNDASNYGGLTIKSASDNSTWANELSYLDIAGTQNACFQMIPNVTTDTTTTPKITEVWLDYKSIVPPEIYIAYPEEGVTYYGVSNIDLNFTLIDPDGISSAWYSLDYGANTTIETPTNNVSVAITSGTHTFILSANDTDGQENQTSVSFNINLVPSIPALHLPENESVELSAIPQLNWSNSTDSEGDAISYYLEVDDDAGFGSVDYVNNNIAETANTTGDTPTGLGDGNWYWRVLATDSYGNSSWSEVREFRLELTQPQIFIDSPENTTYYNISFVDLNTTATDPDGIDSMWWSTNLTDNVTDDDWLTNATISGLSEGNWIVYVYYNDSAGVENSTSRSFFVNDPPTPPVLEEPQNDTSFNSIPTLEVNNSVDTYDTIYYYFEIANLSDFVVVDRASGDVAEGSGTTTWTPTYLADGNYSWRALATDTHSNSSWSSEVRSFVLDTTDPVLNDIGNVTDLITQNLPVKSAINITATDDNRRACWYYTSDSSTNVSIDCNSGTYTDISWTTEGSKIIYACVNDTAGNEACISESLMIDYFTLSQNSIPTSSTSEGGQIKFNLTIDKTALQSQFPNTYAVLWINNTRYDGVKTSFTNGAQFIYNLFVPDGWGNTTGITQYWNWSYAIYNSTTILENETTAYSTIDVYDAGLDDCTSYGNIILNFTLYDEEEKTMADANITIETTATLTNPYNANYFFNYSASSNESSLTICASNEFLNYTDFNLSTITRYEFQDHVVEYHYIELYNQSGYSKQDVELYDLKTADSTSFLMSYDDEFYLPVSDAVIDVWRYYVDEGLYRSVEHGKTNADGETRAHLVTEDVKYIFKVRKNNRLLYTSDPSLAICQSTPCVINLRATSGDIPYKDFDKVDNLEYTLTTDRDARQVVLTFSTDDGSTTTMKMNVTQSDQFYNETACSETLTSSGGTITCEVSADRGNTTFDVWVWKDDEFVAFDSFSLAPTGYDTFGHTGVIMAVIVIITLPLMAITSGIAMIVFVLIGIVFMTASTLLTGGSIIGIGSTIIWIICAGVIIIVKLSKRRYA